MKEDQQVYYTSTRDSSLNVTASKAILQGLSKDGGLFVPDHIPQLDKTMKELSVMRYNEVAYEVMRLFLTDFSEEDLKRCISSAYSKDNFDTDPIVPLVAADNAYYIELFHGPTIAFKDMALQLLPYLMTTAARMNDVSDEIVILTATSGDTGKAALAGFADVKGTKIVVFYPKDGVSHVQEKQMITQKGDNTCVVGIHGNFDDAQTGVKKLFGDRGLEEKMKNSGFRFSSANSINIGRLVPQIVYYVYSYSQLLAEGRIKEGEKINVTVPTGNFGNILAAYFAKNMGVPIDRLICASNENKVLFDFFRTGTYDRNRDFILTTSPSMDILISSNLERLIYMTADCSSERCASLMRQLSENGRYDISDEMRSKMSDFYGGYASEKECAETIKHIYSECGYVIDTHTSVAASVYNRYREETGDTKTTLIASTASPYKFAGSVMCAIDPENKKLNDIQVIDMLSEKSGTKIPKAIKELISAPVRHKGECGKDGMKDKVMEFLKI